LRLGCVMASFCIGIAIDGSVLICVRQNAKMGVGRGKGLFGSYPENSLSLRLRKLHSSPRP
jgi:hypothetical protein